MNTMQNEIMVSVIVLTYNHEKYIRQALDSILMQQVNFKYEILVGDDYSNDGTREILMEYQNKYPDIFCVRLRQRNIGATKNLYELLMLAAGRYIAYLEGDDYWCDVNKLSIQVDFLENDLEYIACTHECQVVDENGIAYNRQYLSWIFEKEEYTLQDFHGIILPGHGNSMLQRNFFFENVSQYKEVITIHHLIADRSLTLLLASKGKIYKFSNVMGSYRRSQGIESKNATAILYEKNKNYILDDYVYTKKLECYASEQLKVDAGFDWHKKDLFVSVIYLFLRHPSIEALQLIKMILDENSIKYILYIPFGIAKKIWYKFVKKEWSI